MDRFASYEVSIELIRALRVVMPKIKQHDADLAKQIRRAATSIALNLGEGRKRVGEDRTHLFRIANGSAGEVEAGLDVAESWGYVDAGPELRRLLSRLLGLLWGLVH
jgi:four helix bundle protein